TTDNNFLESYALTSGDLVSNITVVNKIKNKFKEPFLGGQNHYAAFAEMAQKIDGRKIQATDDVINNLFREAVESYVSGQKTKQQALQEFRNDVQRQLGINH
ncbi:MAG: carbohydrate ABC transporter substrate-binding protein, partial [Treponema sp.]|nr:carbohydrate ABC transporter substrate-binding protein [Treponema sp.]